MTSTIAFFDQILAQIESGHADEAIARLAGMLDHGCDQGNDIVALRRGLIAHPLFDLLRHESATAIAQRGDGKDDADRIDRLIGVIVDSGSVTPDDASARMLADAVGGSALYRAIRARVSHAGEMLERTWREGRSIAIAGGTVGCELAYLGDRELGNVTIAEGITARAAAIRATLDPAATVHALPLEAFLARVARAGARFDLLYLPRFAETVSTTALAAVFAQAAPLLSATGSIVFPAFLAGRIGGGWQRTCLDWDAHDHDETALSAAADAAGLPIRIFRDAAGCFLWCVLDRSDGQTRKGVGDGR